MDALRRLKSAVRELSMAAPCPEPKIQTAEKRLGQRLPDVLRAVYKITNGFCGPTGAQFLWPIGRQRQSLVGLNLFFRQDLFPPMVRNWVLFGDEGGGAMWAIDPKKPDQVIRWDAEWGDDFEIAGQDPFEAWARKQAAYDEAEQRLDKR